MSNAFVAARLLGALCSALTVVACSGESPITPSPSYAVAGDLSAKPSSGIPGVYDLSFTVYRNGTYEEVSSLAVSSQELLLKGYVTDSSGRPAQKGTVTFEYRSVQGWAPERHPARGRSPEGSVRAGVGHMGATHFNFGQRWTLSTAGHGIRVPELWDCPNPPGDRLPHALRAPG